MVSHIHRRINKPPSGPSQGTSASLARGKLKTEHPVAVPVAEYADWQDGNEHGLACWVLAAVSQVVK
jgi:hypothetical protein